MSLSQMPTSGAPMVRQGRPFDNAYCVLSLYERDMGVRVTAYNSETLTETELLLPWETVSASVGHVNSKTPMERKRPAFDKLLSRIVLEKGIDGSTQLRLTAAPTNTATRRAGDLDAKSSTLSSTGLGRGESMTLDISQPNSIMNPSQSSSLLLESSSGSLPLVSPLVTGNAQSRRGPGFTTTGGSSSTGVLSPLRGARKPVGTGNGNTSTLSPAHTLPMSPSRLSKPGSAGGMGSTRRTSPVRMEIGGYVPPTDLSSIPNEIVFQAKRMLYPEANEQLVTFLREPASKLAAKKLGINLQTLKPRTLESFKEGPKDNADSLALKLKYYEKARAENLSLILSERATAEQRLLEEQRIREEQELKLSAGFLEHLNQMKKKLDVSENLKKKVLEAGIRENEMMRKRREEFERSREAFERRCDHIQDLKRKQKEQLEYKGQLKANKIATVQHQRDYNEKAWQEEIKRREEERLAKMGHQRELLQAGEEEKARRQAERARQREEKKRQAEEEAEYRRTTLLSSLGEKTGALDAAKQKAKEDVARRKIERWVAAQAKKNAAERVRRERQFRLEAQQRKIEMDARKMEAIADMKAAMAEERVAKKREERIELDKWKQETVFERTIMPGPGEYRVPSFTDGQTKGGVLSRAKAESMLDKVIQRAARVPGPANYETRISAITNKGGVIGHAAVKGVLDEIMERAEQLPGVGDYTMPVEEVKGASSFNNAIGDSMMSEIERHAKNVPAPGQYSHELLPRPKQSLDDLKKKFSRAKTKLRVATKFIMRTEKLAAAAFLRDLDKKNQLRGTLDAGGGGGAAVTGDDDDGLGESKVDYEGSVGNSSSGGDSPSPLARAALGMLKRGAAKS